MNIERFSRQGLKEGQRRYGAKNDTDKHEHDFKKVVETDGAHWFVCKTCGERMTVPKE